MIRLISLLLLCASVVSATLSTDRPSNQANTRPHRTHPDYPVDQQYPHHYVKRLDQLAVGSCSNQNRPQPLWDVILHQKVNQTDKQGNQHTKPDLFVWLGDVVYADHALPIFPLIRWAADPEFIGRQFEIQRERPDYQQVIDNLAIVGIWDDHGQLNNQSY